MITTKNIKTLLLLISFVGICTTNNYAQNSDSEKYPSTVISNEAVSLKVYLPDAKKGFYRSTRFDWSGVIASAQYNGHEYFGAWKDAHDPLSPADIVGPAESSRGAGLGYDEAQSGDGFIRLGVGILEKGNETKYDPNSKSYKILDHGKWKVKNGDDWISFKHTINSDFGYAYIYTKTVRLNDKGFHIEHTLQNTGTKTIDIDQYNHNFFVIDEQPIGTSYHIKYPYRTKTEGDTKDLVKVGGLDIEFLKDFAKNDDVSVEVTGFKPSALHNKFSIENSAAGAGVLVSVNQPITQAQFWANEATLCPQHSIQLSIDPDKSQSWTSKYILFEAEAAKQVDYTYSKVVVEPEVLSLIEDKWKGKFVQVTYPQQFLDKVIKVNVGEDIQAAIDEAHAAGGGVVSLAAGTHVLKNTLTLKSKVTLIGAGKAQTVLLQGAEMKGTGINVEDQPQLTDVVIKDLTLRGLRDGDGNGILIRGRNESRHTRIMMQNVTVADWAKQGVHIKRTNNIIMDKCDIQYNGTAGGLHHNVYFLYNKYLLQSDCDMSYPVTGKGNKYTSFEHVIAQRCTIRDCKGNGIQIDNEEAGYIFFHKYNISGCGHAALWFPCEYYYNKFDYTEDLKYAPQNVILNRCKIVDNAYGAMWRRVEGAYVINSTFDNRKTDMMLLKCDVTFENSIFNRGNKELEDVDEWPQAGKVLW